MTKTGTEAKTSGRRVQCGTLTAELLPRAAYEAAYTPQSTVAGFAFDIQTGQHAFGGDRLQPFLTRPFSLALTPCGCDIRSRSDKGGEYLTITIMPGREHEIVETYAPENIRQYSNGMVPEIAPVAIGLRQALLTPMPAPGAIEEAASLLIEAALTFGLYTSKPTRPATSLTQPRMRLLHEQIEEQFASSLSIADMAGTLGLSTGFFIRAFKAATGLTPHMYLTDRRLAEARFLMADRTQGLAAIAAMSGFSSQAHMTTAFRARLGQTPARYRMAMQ